MQGAWVPTAMASVAVVVVAVLAGCVSPGQAAACEPAALHTPWVEGTFLRTDPAQPWDTVVLQRGGDAGAPAAHPAGWSLNVERLSGAGEGNFSLLRVEPGHGKGELTLAYNLPDCEGKAAKGKITWPLMAPEAGDSASPGQGVHVYTAGFWENGTLFYTNIEAVDHGDWPRAGWYAWEGDAPLPVYVYDEDRSEQPLAWTDPTAGTPLAGTVPGLGYFTTIPGFNEALKGLSTSTVRVVRLAPEEGYTRSGAEDHPLYGDALVFYIKVVHVVDLPCPLGVARACDLPVPAL